MLFGGPMRKIIKPQLETIRYNLKESKESLQQSRKESPISLWFSYGKRQRLRYSIGISVGYDDWDFERQRVRRNRSLIINSATVNRYLDKLQNELIHHYSELVLEGKDVNNGILRSILDRLTNRNIESEDIVNQNNFFVFAHEFVEEKREHWSKQQRKLELQKRGQDYDKKDYQSQFKEDLRFKSIVDKYPPF